MIPRRPSAFSLIELLVVVAITASLMATSIPVIAAMIRDARMAGAMARVRAGLQETRLLVNDHAHGDTPVLNSPTNRIAHFSGAAMVFRWDEATADYEIFYALHDPNAIKDASGTLLESLSTTTDPQKGYSRFANIEPTTLGLGVRAAGMRRDDSRPNGLALVGGSFAVCIDGNGVATPPAKQIYVNLQTPPPSGATGPLGPWNIWNTSGLYPAGGNPATAGGVAEDGATGEGFATALPVIILYHDDALPHDEAGPGDGFPANTYRLPDGSLNPALDPDELLRVTKGRIEMLTAQGGSPFEFE